MCNCLVHEQPCWAYIAVGYEYGLASGVWAADMLGEPRAKKLRRVWSGAAGAQLARPARWTQRAILGHGHYDLFERPLFVNVAGWTCTDWTGLGKQKRGSGTTSRFFYTWRAERKALAKQLLEDFWLGENSDRFAVEKEARRPMDDTHRVLHVVFGPLEMGIPIRRRRALMAGLNRRTMVWTGPQDLAAIQAAFESLFKRTYELFWRCFLGAEEEEVHQ